MSGNSTNFAADFLTSASSPLDPGIAIPSFQPASPFADPLRTTQPSSSLPVTESGLVPPLNSVTAATSGWFTVDNSGTISIDYLFDGGALEGELGIFSLSGLEAYTLGSNELIQEVTRRVLSQSTEGYLAISDALEGARFSSGLGWEGNFNSGTHLGVKTFTMNAGDRFGIVTVANGTFQELLQNPNGGKFQTLFSMAEWNPKGTQQFGQLTSDTSETSVFAFEDLRLDIHSDRDYNDMVFQIRGATATAIDLSDLIDDTKDWRDSAIGTVIQTYVAPYDNPQTTQPTDYSFPKSQQPLIGIIDTGFAVNNPDIDYSRITLGRDYVDGDNNPLLTAGEGNEHGTHILGIIGATQNNGIGIDGINDQAPIWLGRAIGSGQWATSLFEFVEAAKQSGQPNAVVNLSFDLTQIQPDGSVTTRQSLNSVERAALEYAKQNNVLVVVSSGNQGSEMSALAEASLEFDNVLTVGAANETLTDRADYSSFGSGLDLLAPGQTSESVGTSTATAIASGVISQLWAANPDLSYRQIKEILKSTAIDLGQPGWDAETGAGLLNADAALQVAKQTQPEAKIPPTSQNTTVDLATPTLDSSWEDDSIVYTATSDGRIIRIDTETGESTQVHQGRAFTDIALSANGKLYGSTFNQLFEIDLESGQETLIGSFPSNIKLNGLTFAPDGRLFGADSNTGKVYLVSPDTAQTIEFASLGAPSSGDIVFNGQNEILASVKGPNGDRLVAVDVSTGHTQIIGDLGFQNVQGLALVDGVLNAFTNDGQKLEIDPRTGAATIVSTVTTGNGALWETRKQTAFSSGVSWVGTVTTGNGELWGTADNPSSRGIMTGALPVAMPEGEVDPNAQAIDIERPADWASKVRASEMGSDWRTEYDRTEAWIGSITSRTPRLWWRDQQGRNWERVETDKGYMIRTPSLGAFSFSWEERNTTKSWDLFWNAVSAGLSRNQIIALKDAAWTHRQYSTQILGPLRYRESSDGRGWVQEFDGADGKRFLMLENGANQAFLVHGDNYREYMALGGPEGRLGFPRNNEQYIKRADGKYATWQQFSSSDAKARIHHLGSSVATWGAIGSVYTDMHGAGSFLKMPTRHEYIDGDTIWSDFEGGRIAHNRNTGETVALKPGEQPSWRLQKVLNEPVSGSEWRTSVFKWSGNQPPANFWENSNNLLGVINLGSNTREDGKRGVNFQDWGTGSPRGNQLPSDAFVMRSYTQNYFEAGKTYKAKVRADDGYQLLAKKWYTNQWVYFTPKDQWMTDAYGAYKEVEFRVPETGWYDFHFHYYEAGGNAYFDLTWEEINRSLPSYTELVNIPSGLNSNLSSPSATLYNRILGNPNNGKHIVYGQDVGPFKVSGLKPAIESLKQIFAKVQQEKPELYKQLGTAGMRNVRYVSGTKIYSNHSWGAAIDVTIGNKLDSTSDGKTQLGLLELYPYFHEAGWFWGAVFNSRNLKDDSMHFEVSTELLNSWKNQGLLN